MVFISRTLFFFSFLIPNVCMWSHFSRVWLFAILWTVAWQALLSMGFSRQEYWSGLPFPPPRDLPDRDWTCVSYFPALAGRFFTTNTTWEAQFQVCFYLLTVIFKLEYKCFTMLCFCYIMMWIRYTYVRSLLSENFFGS